MKLGKTERRALIAAFTPMTPEYLARTPMGRLYMAWCEAGRPATVSNGTVLARLAVEAGIVDKSYPTVRWGRVGKFDGNCVAEIDGNLFIVTGHSPEGDAQWIARDGYISFEEREPRGGQHGA